ncbi:MAG: hypothetical protein U0Y82_02775 [Thermoleophilia bacterium]
MLSAFRHRLRLRNRIRRAAAVPPENLRDTLSEPQLAYLSEALFRTGRFEAAERVGLPPRRGSVARLTPTALRRSPVLESALTGALQDTEREHSLTR